MEETQMRKDMVRLAHDAARGDVDAAMLILAVVDAFRYADDILDGDSPDPALGLGACLAIGLAGMPRNAFYQKHPEVSAVIEQGVLGWVMSERWTKSPNREHRIEAYIARNLINQVGYFVAFRKGGLSHAIDIAERMRALCDTEGETLDDWEAEHGMVG